MDDNLSSSSMVSGLSQASFLQRTLERLSSTQCLKLKAEDRDAVAVIALQRYLSEQSEGLQQQHTYTYDVTVTDGVCRAKCFVHPCLNHLVHTNTLRTGTDINITQCSFVYNERRLGHGYICIERLRCGAETSVVLPRINDVSSLPILVKQGMERSVVLQSDVPLQVSRKHYLSLWNDDDPEGDIWTSGSPSSDTVLDVSKISLLSSLESSFRSSWKPLPLLVKIIHKSRLRYYGKFGLKIDFPYQAYFEVADQTGTMSLVLWNELCPEFYQRLNVGTVLYLQNYTTKQSYSCRSRPQMDHHRLKTFNSVEICLNPRNPASVITIVSPKSVLPQWGLPEVSYQFITRSELEKLTNNSACDVIGLVTFVGRVERVKRKGNKGPEKYWTYRWVHAVDGTSNHPFILEIFSSSQPEIFSCICPMTYLVCTQMRVCQVEGSLPYLTSSCETETFITGYHKGQPYVSDLRVKNFIQWTKTLKDNVVLKKTAVGGHYCYPCPPKMFTQSMADASAQVPLVAVADLKRELETLQYREHKKVAIQGQITAVQYMKTLKTTESQVTEEREVPDVSTDMCVPDTHSHPTAAEQTLPYSLRSPSAENISAGRGKRRIQVREATQSSSNHGGVPSKRRAGDENTKEGQEQEENERDSELEDDQEVQCHLQLQNPNQDSDVLSWESSSWLKQKHEVSEHLCQGGLYQDSISQKFTSDTKNVLLQWSNLQPTRWTPAQTADTVPPVVCPGYYQVTILGINKQIAVDAAYFPVVSADEPRAVGLAQDPHGNTMLSCLASGFLCPLSVKADDSDATLPEPEDILATTSELEDTHVVGILDLCHLGGDKVEVLINKVYRVTEVSLE
ncbi:RPA-related protein RADX [Seriola lalandi dorsalis]|uniref:RPA1 related single stranded DNA binding protein, X-linked n=1 Tax=Seriola lalandi dorsalis TaxID=1841481 RepID=A0A3B4XSE1_SERLL|nr:RPA-related protein RADX [Seriola lalandi dorsalis]XP_056252897.1 RPA-related protein RADX [Seriola aureovittata]